MVNNNEANAGRDWLAIVSLGVGAFVVVTTEFLPIGVLHSIATDMHVTDGTAGLAVTTPGLLAAFAAPTVTVAAGRFDRRAVILTLMALVIAANVCAVIAPSFPVFLFGRVLLGITVGGFWSIAPGLATRLVPQDRVARATATILAGISIGTVLGLPIGTLVGSYAGWRVAFMITAVLGLIAFAGQLALLPRLPATHVVTTRDLFRIVQSADARLGLSVVVLIFIGQFAAYTYLTPFLTLVAKLGPVSVGALLLVYGAAGLAGNYLAAAGATRSLRLTLAIAIALALIPMALLPVIGTSLIGCSVLTLLWGSAFGAIPISLQLWMFASTPDAPEGGSAAFVGVLQICLASGALLGGIFVDAHGVSSAFTVGAVFAALALVPLAFGRSPGRATASL